VWTDGRDLLQHQDDKVSHMVSPDTHHDIVRALLSILLFLDIPDEENHNAKDDAEQEDNPFCIGCRSKEAKDLTFVFLLVI